MQESSSIPEGDESKGASEEDSIHSDLCLPCIDYLGKNSFGYHEAMRCLERLQRFGIGFLDFRPRALGHFVIDLMVVVERGESDTFV